MSHDSSFAKLRFSPLVFDSFCFDDFNRVLQKDKEYLSYFGILLTDLTFLCDGNPDSVEGLTNISKVKMIGKVTRYEAETKRT